MEVASTVPSNGLRRSAVFDDVTLERFWSKVDRSGGPDACWSWKAFHHPLGYGSFAACRTKIPAHRYALASIARHMPDSETHACHACDNRGCVNPAHLHWGTRSDNLSEAASRGRLAAQKVTHCPQGHAYAGSNLYITPTDARACRECRRAQRKASQLRRQSK